MWPAAVSRINPQQSTPAIDVVARTHLPTSELLHYNSEVNDCVCGSTQVRKTAADQLYTMLLTYDGLLPDDVMDHVITVLADTTW